MIVKHASSAVAVLEVAEASSKHATLMKDAHRHTFDYQPRKGFIYIRSRAISSRTNDNYDTFPADELRKSWGSFVGKPVFVNHHNDDHTRMRGVIIDAALHDDTAPDGTDDTWVEVLMEVDAKKFPKLAEALIKRDIERTSMGCFLPGTPITMADGSRKPIEEVGVGDEVLTHTGKVEPVTYTMVHEHDALVYDIKVFGRGSDLVATPEHPFWVRRSTPTNSRARRKGLQRSTSCDCGRQFDTHQALAAHRREASKRGEDHASADREAEWIQARDLVVGDWVLTPAMSLDGHPGSRPMARLLGYYLAEGSLGYDKQRHGDEPRWVQWDFHEDEVEYVQEVVECLATLGYRAAGPYVKNTSASIRCNSPELAATMLRLGGKSSWQKRLDPDVLRWSRENLYGLLTAYWNGDGCYRGDRVESGTASKVLAEQLHVVAVRCGVPITPAVHQHSPSMVAQGQRPKYVLSAMVAPSVANFSKAVSHDQVRVDEQGVWRRITDVAIRSYAGPVYNFDVEGDDSYVAADVAVHNCDVMESECSYCGNVARQPNEYCAHVQRMKGQRLRRKDPHTGAIQDVLVHEVCRGLHFFENSLLVEDPADPTAYAFGLDVRGVLDEGDDIAMFARTMPKAASKIETAGLDDDLARDIERIDWSQGSSRMSHRWLVKTDRSLHTTKKAAEHHYLTLKMEAYEEDDADRKIRLQELEAEEQRLRQQGSTAEVERDREQLAVDWLLRLRELQAGGMSFDEALAVVNAEADDAEKMMRSSSLEGVGITDTVTVPPQVETLRLQECPVCDAEATWNSDGRCDVCGYLPAPKPFREPDIDIAGRTDHDGGWFDPDLATAKPFTLASSNPVGSPHSASKRQKANPQGAHDMSKQQPSVATAARRRTATARPSESEQRLARENAQLREMVARLRTRADVNNPANPVPEPAPGAPADTDEGARSKPQAQNVDVENAGGVLPDPQDAPASVTTPGDEMVDPILAGTNQTDDVEVPVAGTTSVDPDAVEEVVPDTRAETFGEPAYRGDWINPGANTVPDIGGNAATARKREAALVGRAVNATRDRIWASLRLARLRIETGLAQGDDIEVARQIEASNDMPMNVLHNEIATLTSVAARRPVREASAPQRRQERTATRTPSLAAGVQPVISGLAHRGGEDEALFE